MTKGWKMKLFSALMGLLGLFAGPALAADDILSPPDAFEQAQAGRRLLIDVRTPDEWKSVGMPKGAVGVDVGSGADAFVSGVLKAAGGDKSRPLAVICRSGHRSTKAQALLRQAGFTDVLNVVEGVSGGGNGPGWIARGLPVQ